MQLGNQASPLGNFLRQIVLEINIIGKILWLVILTVFVSEGALSQGVSGEVCIDHSSRQSLNSVQIIAKNRCSKTILANICARIDGRIGEIKEGQRIAPNSTYIFDMFNANKSQMRYNIAQCEPGATSRNDLCVPSCPPETASKGAMQSFPIRCVCGEESLKMSIMAMSRQEAEGNAKEKCANVCSQKIQNECNELKAIAEIDNNNIANAFSETKSKVQSLNSKDQGCSTMMSHYNMINEEINKYEQSLGAYYKKCQTGQMQKSALDSLAQFVSRGRSVVSEMKQKVDVAYCR